MTPHISGNGETNKETSNVPKMNVFDTDDIIGHPFLLDRQEDGQRLRARIVRTIKEQENELAMDPDKIKGVMFPIVKSRFDPQADNNGGPRSIRHIPKTAMTMG